jgi:hypothetical protein
MLGRGSVIRPADERELGMHSVIPDLQDVVIVVTNNGCVTCLVLVQSSQVR